MEELIRDRFPKSVTLKDGSRVTLRPLEPSDEDRLGLFFHRIPEVERAIFRENVIDSAVIHRWCSQINFRQIFPLLAVEGARIVADATLHFRPGTWMRHVAQLRIAVDPGYRARGLARIMLEELIELSLDLDVDLLDAEVLSGQTAAMKLITGLGFKEMALLPDHARDLLGNSHDIVLLSRDVKTPENEEGGGS